MGVRRLVLVDYIAKVELLMEVRQLKMIEGSLTFRHRRMAALVIPYI